MIFTVAFNPCTLLVSRPLYSIATSLFMLRLGGLFAMDRKLFHEIGEYDPEMQLYGGEEMEISYRIWQCGELCGFTDGLVCHMQNLSH